MRIVVHDLPAPQGSKRHVGNGVMVESSQRVKPWREAVKQAALDAGAGHGPEGTLTGPVALEVTFTLPRPKAHYRTGRNAHLLRDNAPTRPDRLPDLDKLLRSTMDALTAAGVWVDDAQVVGINARKVYPDHLDALEHPGAAIRVAPIEPRKAPHV